MSQPNTLPTGLTTAEAQRRLTEYGPNFITPEAKRARGLAILLKAATDPMAILLFVATPIYAILGDYASAAFTAAAIIPVTAIDVFLEQRAENALEQLREMTAPTALVIRDGAEQVVPSEQLVPGDSLVLREGDVVSADGQIIQGAYLLTNEAALTGESATVTKGARVEGEAGEVFAGTSVVAGEGIVEVTATGGRTRFGLISSLVATAGPAPTPLQQAVRRLITRLSAVAAVFCFGVVAVQLAYGVALADALLAGISLAIAAVPEEFTIIFTLYLGLGAWRLAREKALVRRLVAVETLGSTTVICADKTGTLTLGDLHVTDVAPFAGSEVVSDSARLVKAACMACEVRPFDPLDLAILDFASGIGQGQPEGELAEDYPFDPHRKYLTHVWRLREGYYVAAKGSVEGILATSNAPAEVAEAAFIQNRALAGRGIRVIAVAGGTLTHLSQRREEDEEPLRFLGLVGFVDPVRPGVMEALASCRRAGIRVVMVTGDHPVTAAAVASSLGLDSSRATASGDDLDHLSDDGLRSLVGEASIFARIRPEQKFRIVQALRARGEIVAMTGDGINDAPALRQADIGVALGQRGTAVAREAATLILLDDNFSTIVSAVREGRRTFENLRRAFLYLLGFHIPVLIGALLPPLLNQPLLLTPVNLVLLEIILHPTVSLVFVNDPLDEKLMSRPPRARNEALIRPTDALLPMATGLSLTVAVIGLFLARLEAGAPEQEARAIALLTLVFGQLLLAMTVRTPERSVLHASYTANRVVLPTIIGAVAVLLIAVLVPGMNQLMKVTPPDEWWWLVTFVVAAAAVLWMEPLKQRFHEASSEGQEHRAAGE